MALVKDPWAVLEVQLRPDSVSNLVPLAGGGSVGDRQTGRRFAARGLLRFSLWKPRAGVFVFIFCFGQ